MKYKISDLEEIRAREYNKIYVWLTNSHEAIEADEIQFDHKAAEVIIITYR